MDCRCDCATAMKVDSGAVRWLAGEVEIGSKKDELLVGWNQTESDFDNYIQLRHEHGPILHWPGCGRSEFRWNWQNGRLNHL